MRRTTALILALILAIAPLPALAAETPSALMDFVQNALESEKGLIYEKEEDYFTLLFEADDPRLGCVLVYVDVYQSGSLVTSCWEQPLPTEAIDEAIRFVNLMNSDALGGKYYVDPESGYVYYEEFFSDSLLDVPDAQSLLLDTIYVAEAELDYDVDYFMELIGGETAENAFAMYLADH